jgi:hypothetical protein
MLFRKRPKASPNLYPFHPTTLLRDWGNGEGYTVYDALTGVAIFGATGSGKTSGPGKHIAYAYLAHRFGGLVLCAKPGERRQWETWANETGRSDDLVIIEKDGQWRYNFLDAEASRAGVGGGMTINIVALLDEVAGALAREDESGGNNRFWDDALHHMNTNLVDLPLFASLPVSLSLLRSIVNSAPLSIEQLRSEEWQETSACAAILREADQATMLADPGTRADFEECKNYWLIEWPNLSEKTRSIISLSFSMLVRPFITRPLADLLSKDTTICPEDAFDGKIIIVDLPIQEFRLAGRVAHLVWKYCFQVAVLRRMPPSEGYLRPVFLWADEAQNFVSEFDAEYQAVARSAGGCTVYLTQNRESYKRVLGNDAAVDSLLGNLQCKIFCQNSGETNEWAARLLGERYINISGTNVGHSDIGHQHSGVSTSEQKRHFVEPSAFTTLKRGGDLNGRQVEAIVYNGGKQFLSASGKEMLPFKLLTFNQ